MKRISALLLILFCALPLKAQKEEITKSGLGVGPFPALAYDADKGFQLGGVLMLFDYGTGENYPALDSKFYSEFSYFTKGSKIIRLRYDTFKLIPGVRNCTNFQANIDKAYDFYGFNGYETYFDAAQARPFYRYSRYEYLFKSDFIGRLAGALSWEAGIYASYYKLGSIDYASINKGKSAADVFPENMPTLYDACKASGVISAKDADGGFSSGVRFGLVYDTRNKEGAPSRGIWAEGHVLLAPLSETPFYRYSFTWRHYLPLIPNDVLTLAYRFNYEGTFGRQAPFYVLPYMTFMGQRTDLEGMGGYETARGIMRTRLVGLDMGCATAELRWRFASFVLWNQNIALAANIFTDAARVFRGLDISALPSSLREILPAAPADVQLRGTMAERVHQSAGAGIRLIVNENLVVACDRGYPLDKQDGDSPALYITLDYLF